MYRWIVPLPETPSSETAYLPRASFLQTFLDWTVVPFGRYIICPIAQCVQDVIMGGMSGIYRKESEEEPTSPGSRVIEDSKQG